MEGISGNREESARIRAELARFAEPEDRSAWLQLATTVPPYLALGTLMGWSCSRSIVATLALGALAGMFLVRTFILQHDCAHYSLFRSRRINETVGCTLALLTFTPFHNWRIVHNLHHATSGDLDRRNQGDIWLMTVEEYLRSDWLRRTGYRLFRNPLFLFGLGPSLYFLVRRRFPVKLAPTLKQEIRNVHLTNIALFVFYGTLCWSLGPWRLAMVLLPIVVTGSSVGTWLFYIQHQFETGYWRRSEKWDAFEASLSGSSYYELPAWLNWFTADIAVHHIHHLDCRVPNYRLRDAMREIPGLEPRRTLRLRESLGMTRLKLWDERSGKLVGFPR
ncbi:MAG: fatty acid desaturase [Oligoflexia bacterium]|nr:fatty acid desaturase [Oligoflexia bacterium]